MGKPGHDKFRSNVDKVGSLIMKDVALIWLPVYVVDHLLTSFVISDSTLYVNIGVGWMYVGPRIDISVWTYIDLG